MPKGDIAPSGKSYEKFSRPFDMHGLRRSFPDLWAEFLKAHFRDHKQISYMFDVDQRTAQNWLNGRNAPRPEFVLTVVKRMPVEAAMLLGAA